MFIEPDHYVDLFQYDGWANRRFLDVLSEASSTVPSRAMELMSHLLRSQAIWLARLEETEDVSLPLWQQDSVEECRRRSEVNNRAWLAFLNTCAAGDFNKEIAYKNTKGEPFTQALRQILNHVVNHGTHHRAQIALLLRHAGTPPPPTDYIIYARSLPGA